MDGLWPNINSALTVFRRAKGRSGGSTRRRIPSFRPFLPFPGFLETKPHPKQKTVSALKPLTGSANLYQKTADAGGQPDPTPAGPRGRTSGHAGRAPGNAGFPGPLGLDARPCLDGLGPTGRLGARGGGRVPSSLARHCRQSRRRRRSGGEGEASRSSAPAARRRRGWAQHLHVE